MPSLFDRWAIDAALDARRAIPDSIRTRAGSDASLRASVDAAHRVNEMLRAPGAMPVLPAQAGVAAHIFAAIDEAPSSPGSDGEGAQSDGVAGSGSGSSWAGWTVFAVSSISVVLASAWLATRMNPGPAPVPDSAPEARGPAANDLETPDVVIPPPRQGEGKKFEPPPPRLDAARTESRPAEGLSSILPSPLRTAPAIIRSLLASPKQSIAAVVEAPVQREARLLAEDSRKLADSLLAPVPFATLPSPPGTPDSAAAAPGVPSRPEAGEKNTKKRTGKREKEGEGRPPIPPTAPDAPR